MKFIEDLISPLVKEQFPAFYKEEGEVFIQFVKSYYKWLEKSNNPLYHSRNLLEYRDIDATLNKFVTHFKETYLKNFPRVSISTEKLLLKNALYFYQNKGDPLSVKLAIQALFNKESSVYYPGEDIFKTSDGTWVEPTYLEISVSKKNSSFNNKEIIGSISGARAFCEGVVKKRINSKYIDLLYLSNRRGNFVYGEKITEVSNTNLIDSPSVVGSLNGLTVINGGQGFLVGDKLDIISNNGKNGKAVVRSISTATGTADFNIVDGGWGFSTNATVLISDKVLRVSNVTNSNTFISGFERFETVRQDLINLGVNSAINTSMLSVNTVIFAQGNNTVSNSTAGIVAITIISGSRGILTVTNLTGNIAATNSTIKAVLVDVTFDTSSNISSFSNNSYIISSNSTANASAYIVTSSTTNSTHGSLLVNPISGNLLSTNATFRLLGNNNITGIINTYSSNLSFTATIVNNSIITANGTFIGSNNSHIGLDGVVNAFQPNSIFSRVRGISSNTYANFDFVSTGSGANFVVGSLDYEEEVLLCPDFIGGKNIGNVPFLSINLDLNPNNANSPGYGFVKYPGSDITSRLIDTLRFIPVKVGTITQLKNINPGQGYNLDPFVLVIEKDIAGYQYRDFNFQITTPTKSFVLGEKIEQTSIDPGILIRVGNFSGIAANGTSTSNFEINEVVFQSNGTSNIATGFVYSTSLVNGTGSVLIRDVTGTFQNTNINGYSLKTLTTNATCNISNSSVFSIAVTNFGLVKQIIDQNNLKVKRISTIPFRDGFSIIGKTSGAVANLVSSSPDLNSFPVGENAIISSNVRSVDSVSSLRVIDSGFGYLQNENVTLLNNNVNYVITAQTNLLRQGKGEGFYSDTGGFLSWDKKLHDSDYYQEYSYEIQSKIPLSRYSEVLKKLVHVAGTKMFGKIVKDSIIENDLLVSSNVGRYTEISLNSISNSSFIKDEYIVFSDGNSNQTSLFVNTEVLSNVISSNGILVIQVPNSNNNFLINRPVYMPNANSYVAQANLIGKSTNVSANVTLLYVKEVVGTFTSSNTISGFVSSNIFNSTSTTTTLSNVTTIKGLGLVKQKLNSVIYFPVSNTLSSNLSGTVSVTNSSLNVIGTGTNFDTSFQNNNFVYITSGNNSVIRRIKTVSNSTHMTLYENLPFNNSASIIKKSFPFISNTSIKSPNSSSNAAFANVFDFDLANSTHFSYLLNNVRGKFAVGDSVEGFINSTSTNTYIISSAINTLVISNTINLIDTGSTISGLSSNTFANIAYLSVFIEK